MRGVWRRLSGINREVASDFNGGHEFHDHRSPSMASSSMKSIDFFFFFW